MVTPAFVFLFSFSFLGFILMGRLIALSFSFFSRRACSDERKFVSLYSLTQLLTLLSSLHTGRHRRPAPGNLPLEVTAPGRDQAEEDRAEDPVGEGGR